MKHDATISELIAWGEQQSDVIAMILTSTRAVPNAPMDRYSDYDVIVITDDINTRFADRSWLAAFGNVVIDWWDPLETDPESGLPTTGNVVYYPGTRKIDFTLWPPEMSLQVEQHFPTELDAGYQVLLDKTGLTANWPAPSGQGYAISLPDCARYREAVNDFFIGVPYVVTALLRGEILPAKWVLDYDMRYEYLLPMLEWYAEILHGPQVRIGNLGKGLQKLLPGAMWILLEQTYAGMDLAANRIALQNMIDLFRDVATKVGDAIGCEYPADLHQRVMAHVATLEIEP